MRQKGFIILPILIAVVLLLSGTVIYFGRDALMNTISPSSTPTPTPEEGFPVPTPSDLPTPFPIKSSTPVKTPTPKPATPKPTTASTPAATTTTTTTTPSCNYDLSSPTGAIEFIFHPTKGSTLYWSTRVEVKAQNGCKVLDGQSTDTIQPFASTTQLNAVVPGIPPGTYDVRYSYHDSWSSSQSVSVSSGGRTEVNYTVDNSSDP